MKKFSSALCVAFVSVLFFLFQFFSYIYYQQDVSCFSTTSITKESTKCDLKYEQLHSKEVFLTFDDGPCVNNTNKILKILNENNVKATFFVVGMKGEENPEILKNLSDSGMSIGIHTYCHDYKKMYKNLDEYLKDLQDCSNVIKKITKITPIPYIRLPGGSTNLVASQSNLNSIKVTLAQSGMKYVDWNVDSGDGNSHKITAEKIKENIAEQCSNKKYAVILMHDTYYNNCTVEALPSVIKYLKDEGFVFRTFDDLTLEEEKEMIRQGILNRS
ncbi:polysaccharide deacetylase family protein [Clostridium sp. DJ247]|uniref:polysaccharide deacetylase family protein n=1 Tax=Clostridium sp. DJ247 TaxID=2726188 RepID=UPI001626FF5F|nr:polysaccharide deacetylase family protein [Clostridium sp. DJ247]MBC2580211.1 polysaccharide deacetylase [Clostridium sp. DJ247]